MTAGSRTALLVAAARAESVPDLVTAVSQVASAAEQGARVEVGVR